MFEQSLYNAEPVATPLAEGDLFNNYELKNWEFTPRIYKILAISGVLNLIALVIFSQTSVLTMKGCDSPLVGQVCNVLDTVYVSSLLFGTERQYVDEAYEKTSIADSDITYVDVSGETPPLSYPEGYFQVANPNEYQAMLDQSNNPTLTTDGFPGMPPGFPTVNPTTGGSLLDTKPNFPQPPKGSVIDGDLPSINDKTGLPDMPPITRRPKGPGMGRFTPPKATVTPKPSPDPNANVAVVTTPEKKVDPVPPTDAIDINKKPLADFADKVSTSWDKKEIDLNQDFTVVLNGTLTKDGKLDQDKSKFDVTKQKGDQKMIDVAKLAIDAVGDSGFLTYLKNLDVNKFTLTLVQDDTQITAVISSVLVSPERANTVATGLRNSISLGKGLVQNPSDERTLLEAATVTSDKKNFILNFAIPKPIAQEMITRKLKEAQAKKALPQPNGNAIVKSTSNSGQ